MVYEEQCTNLNDRFDYLIHRTMFPIFRAFRASTGGSYNRRTLGWRTGPNCNLGNRSSSIEGTVFLNVSFPCLVYHGEISLHVFIPALIGAVRISGFADVCHKLPTQRPLNSRTRHVEDILQVSPDSTVPTDRVLRSEDTQVGKSPLTGENKPVEKRRGST